MHRISSSFESVLKAAFAEVAGTVAPAFFIDGAGHRYSRDEGRRALSAARASLAEATTDTVVLTASNTFAFVVSMLAAMERFSRVIVAGEGEQAHVRIALGTTKFLFISFREQELMVEPLPKGAKSAHAQECQVQRVGYFTSGTTGKKKLLMFAPETLHRRLADWIEQFQLAHGSTFLCTTTFAHSHGLNLHLLPSLALRGTLLAPSLETLTTGTVVRLLRTHRVNVFSAMPQFLDLLLRSKVATGLDLSNVVVISGSDALPQETKIAFEARFGCTIFDQYGCAETGPVAILSHIGGKRYLGPPMVGRSIRLEADLNGFQKLNVTSRSLCDEIWEAGRRINPANPYLLPELCTSDASGLYLLGRQQTLLRSKPGGAIIDLSELETQVEAETGCELVLIPTPTGSAASVLCFFVGVGCSIQTLQTALRTAGLHAETRVIQRTELLRTNLGKKVRNADTYGID
jgi:acyl-coenzyme A synthetase/AMP-(fatty) acid ligase